MLKTVYNFWWEPKDRFWIRGNLTEEYSEWLVQELRDRCGDTFHIWRQRGGQLGSFGARPATVSRWNEFADRARDLLQEGRADGTITRKEEMGYLGAIALIEDRRSRPADKKNAIDLIMRLEGVFEERKRDEQDGAQAKGTKELLNLLHGKKKK